MAVVILASQDLRPIGEGEVRRYDDRGVFVELADEMEQQLRAGLAERQIAEFVDDDEVMTQQGLDDAAAPSGGLFLFELIDQIDEIEEAAARSGADDRGGGRDRQVGLSRTGRNGRMMPVIRKLAARGWFATRTIRASARRFLSSGGNATAGSRPMCVGNPTAVWRLFRSG